MKGTLIFNKKGAAHTGRRRAPGHPRSESWANLQLAIGARSKAPTNDYFEYMTNKQRTKQ